MVDYCKRNHPLSSGTVYVRSDGYTECKQCMRERRLKYQAHNKDRIKIRKRINARKYYRADPEKFQQIAQNFRKEHPEVVRDNSRTRRARVREQMGNYQPWMEKYYRFSQKGACYYCGISISVEESSYSPLRETLEHCLPLSRGGTHSWENTVLCCRDCNSRKGNKTIEEFEI